MHRGANAVARKALAGPRASPTLTPLLEKRSMPITPYLAHQAFDPEIIKTMSAAYVAACDALHLKVGDDPATRAVAEKVINLTLRGIRDPDLLRAMTLKELDLRDDLA